MNQERLFKILLAPCVSEKASAIPGVYVFKVNKQASKLEIKQAVEQNFSVPVEAVRVSTVKGKTRRFQQIRGQRQSWKKAYVTLKTGSEITLGEAP